MEEDLKWLLQHLRAVWPRTRIIVRAQTGFCYEPIMALCDGLERMDYVPGPGSNARLKVELAARMEAARAERERTRAAARRYKDFHYRTRESWTREWRVVGKAETQPAQDNPRFVVTSLPAKYYGARNTCTRTSTVRGGTPRTG